MMIDLLNLKDRELANVTNLVIDLLSIFERQDQEKNALNHEIQCLLQRTMTEVAAGNNSITGGLFACGSYLVWSKQ